MKRTDSARLVAALALLLGASGCAAEISDGSDGAGAGSDSVLTTDNGFEGVNGLRTINGLDELNGLKLTNGLTIENGLRTINGFATKNGLRSVNGLPVDCTNGVPGETCDGVADGLLSPVTGLLKDDLGKLTAAYLAKCALAEGDAIKLKDYTGTLVTLVGALGLAPHWTTELCDTACQENVSACLMALTNGQGQHVQIEMRSTNPAIGQGGTYRYQEAAFYGNMFTTPPTTSFCVGKDFAGLLGTSILSPQQRACGFWLLMGLDCPYRQAGNCTRGGGLLFLFGKPACSMDGDSATACSSPSSSPFSNFNNGDRKWKNVITTYRNSKM
ncbi:MAG TPA: hypothetical protein VI072_29305 [Polyangiaceae bacterium]